MELIWQVADYCPYLFECFFYKLFFLSMIVYESQTNVSSFSVFYSCDFEADEKWVSQGPGDTIFYQPICF